MAKITVKARPLSHKHRAWLVSIRSHTYAHLPVPLQLTFEQSKYTSQFIHDVSTVPLCELSGLIQSFPRGWPFPRGDLHVWISALDRFDEILESFISVYKLKDGPQYLPFGSELLLRSTDSEEPSHANNQQTVSKPFLGEEADLELIKTILGFSALLLENCGNRSLYNSGEHLNQLLNSTSLSLVNSTLEVSVCLAQRYHASIVRHRSYNRGVNSPFAMSSSIERFIYFAVHQPTLIDVAQQPSRDHDQKGKTRASVREALEGVAIPTSALFSLTPLRDDDKIRQASELRFSYHQHNHLGGHQEQQAPRSRDMRAPVQTTAQRGTPRRTNTLSRRTAVDGATGGSTENEPSSPQQGTSRIYKTTVESQSRVLQLSREELLGQPLTNTVARCIHILPDDCKNAFLATLRVAHAILDPMNHSDKVLRMKLLSLIILAHILPEADFEKKILSQDSDQPRRRQLAYQLVDLIRPNSHDQFPVPLKTQTLALETLESLMRQRRRSVAVTSAMSTHVNHGVPFALLRQVLEEIKSTSHLTGNSIEYRWQEALFSLLSKLVSELDRIADGLISAGSFVLIVQVLETRGPGAESSVCHLLGFLDHLIHSSRNGFQIFATEGGLQALANLTARQVKQAADKRGSSGMPQDHRSTLADFTIPLGEQSVLRSVFKLISHAFSHGGTGFDRLLRNLVDSSQLLDALRQIISQPSEYGSAVWSAAVAVVVNFIHHEPTSYAILAEAGLSQAFVDCLTVRSAPSDGDITAIGNVTLASDFFAIRSPVPVGPDAIMAAAQAFGAICLNASGLRLIQDSNVLTEFLLLFASPRHVQNMSQESGFTFRLGSTFNELLRHYPTLRAKILAAIDELMGKLSSVMASEGDTAQPIDRVEDNPVRPDAGDQEVLNGPTVDLSGGDRVSRLTSSQPTGLTIPVMIGNEDVPSPQSFVEQICQFLRAFLTHPSHAASYIKAGGAESLMDLCSSQSLPFNLSQTQAAKSFSQLMIMLIEQKPYLILPSLLNRLNNNARILGPLLARSDHGFFGRFVNSDQNGDEFSPQPTVRALLNAQTLCAAVIRSSQPSPYDRRPRESAIAQVNTLDMYEELLPAIGRLVVACSTELNRLEASVPSGWVKDSDSDFSNMRVSLNSANPSIQAQTPLPPPAIGEAQMLDAGATSTSEQAVSPSHGQSGIGFKNTQVLIWLLSEVADTLTQFLHHVCKHIVGKRQADMDARRVANRVADSVAQMLVAHLRESYDQLSMQAATGFTSLRSCLKLTAKLLFDDGKAISMNPSRLVVNWT